MADDDEKFPEFEPLELINTDLNGAQWGYIQTASRELVTFFKSLMCTNLERGDILHTFAYTNPPYIAPCGHYVHQDCLYDANVLRQTGKEKEQVKSRFRCTDKKCLPLPKTNGFEPFALFQEFYRRIEMSGFPCIGCDKHGKKMAHHPHNNVVRIIARPYDEIEIEMDGPEEELSKYESNAEYLCVWCCAMKRKYANYYVRLVKSTDQAIDDRSIKLSSVDRTLPCSKLPNLECCCCMKPMIPNRSVTKEMGRNSEYPASKVRRYMPCGHIRDEGCIANDGFVYCNPCKKQYDPNELDGKDAVSYFKRYSIHSLFPGYTTVSYNVFKCVECKAFHPRSNMGHKDKNQKTCVWCVVERTLRGRKNDWNEKRQKEKEEEEEEREREQKRSRSKSIMKRLRQSSVSRGTANDQDPLIQ